MKQKIMNYELQLYKRYYLILFLSRAARCRLIRVGSFLGALSHITPAMVTFLISSSCSEKKKTKISNVTERTKMKDVISNWF